MYCEGKVIVLSPAITETGFYSGLRMTLSNQTLTLQQTIIREHLQALIINAFINPLTPLQATGLSEINSVAI